MTPSGLPIASLRAASRFSSGTSTISRTMASVRDAIGESGGICSESTTSVVRLVRAARGDMSSISLPSSCSVLRLTTCSSPVRSVISLSDKDSEVTSSRYVV